MEISDWERVADFATQLRLDSTWDWGRVLCSCSDVHSEWA